MNFCCCSIISTIRALRITEKRPHFPLAVPEPTSLGDSQRFQGTKTLLPIRKCFACCAVLLFSPHSLPAGSLYTPCRLSNKKYPINYAFKIIKIPNKSFEKYLWNFRNLNLICFLLLWKFANVLETCRMKFIEIFSEQLIDIFNLLKHKLLCIS